MGIVGESDRIKLGQCDNLSIQATTLQFSMRLFVADNLSYCINWHDSVCRRKRLVVAISLSIESPSRDLCSEDRLRIHTRTSRITITGAPLNRKRMRGPRSWEHAFTKANELYKYSEYIEHTRAIAYMGIEARKELLKVARCQRSLRVNPFLHSRTSTCKQQYTCPQDL